RRGFSFQPATAAAPGGRGTRTSSKERLIMAKREGFLRFGLFLYPAGHHIAAWRHPDAKANAGIDFDYYRNIALAAEAAKFDLLFLADGAGTRGDNLEILSRTAHSYVAQFEPITLLSAL